MRRILQITITICFLTTTFVWAGNEERTGESGAAELNMDGWARTAGLFGANSGTSYGMESMRHNVAGMARIQKTEAAVSYTRWLGTGRSGEAFNIIMGGVAQKIGADNAIGFSLQALQFGDLTRSITSNPDGDLGTFSPVFINFGLSFSRAFSNSIYGGATVRFITEKIENVSATGFALDAGVQYVTGPKDNIHFGVSIRNLGTPMSMGGNGLSFRGDALDGDYEMTQQQRSQEFSLPSRLNIGAAYDFLFGAVNDTTNETLRAQHRVTPMFNFTSNSVGKDLFALGAEYSWKEMLFVRVAYRFQNGIFSDFGADAHMGLSAGVGFQGQVTKKGMMLGIDYAFRPSTIFSAGTHSVGLRFNL